MKVAHITPSGDLSEHRGYRMFLAPLMVNYSYMNCVAEAKRRGEFLIIDNGAPENPDLDAIDTFPNTYQRVYNLQPDEVVLPDKLGDGATTVAWHNIACNYVPYRQRFAVPQGKTGKEWFDCFLAMGGLAPTYGIPKLLGVKERCVALDLIYDSGLYKQYHFHLLGLSENPLDEIPKYKRFMWIRGIDTGAAMAWAQHDALFADRKERISLVYGLMAHSPDAMTANMTTLEELCI